MKADGKFIIQNGGITQAIQKELGLSNQQCKELGSIWSQIINEFDNPNNMQISNNNNEIPNKSNNYTVYKGAIIEFSKDCWQKIVNLINNSLSNNDIKQIIQSNPLESNVNEVTEKNKKNLLNAYNELKSMTGLFVQKYNLEEDKFITTLDTSYKGLLNSLPNTPCNIADLAMNLLMHTFKELMPNNEREAVENALIEVAEHWKNVEGASIANISCKDIIGSNDCIEQVTNLYVPEANMEEFIEVAKEAIKELITNFENMTFPEDVNKQELFEKLKNYNPENITNLGRTQHDRFGLKFSENPSKADISVAILSDILGMYGDKTNRTIKSEITLRQTAVNNVMKIYDDDMTLRGTKFNEVRNRAEQHQKAINEARDYIKNNFKASGLNKQVDENLFIKCLNSITLDIESSGAGRVEDGVLAIETNDTDIEDYLQEGTTKTRMVKLLIHETYHLYLEKSGQHGDYASKEEEARSEMLALRAMANLCNNDSSLKPFEIYGHLINYYTSNESITNNQEFTSWVSNYTSHSGTTEDAIKKAKNNISL